MNQKSLALPLDPGDLLMFARVAETGSFTKAAEQSGVPKSTLSRRISGLERQMGEPLLIRTTRRQSLTELGSQLLEHAREVAANLDAAMALREQRQALPSGRLRVSMPSDLANLLLADSLAAFSALHPAVTLELDLSPRRVDLLGENFDLAVRMGELPDDALLVATRLAVFTHGLYASPDYLAEHGEPREAQDLGGHLAVRLGTGRQVQPWVLRNADRHWQGLPEARIVANSPETLVKLARFGVGIAAVPDLFAQADVREGRLRRVLHDWKLPESTAWAVTPGRKLLPAKTRAFIEMLQLVLRQAASTG